MKYPTQSCVIKWLKEKMIFELIFWIIVLSCCSELLLELVFWVSVKKTGEVQVLPQNKSYILSIKDYSMMVATRPEPTVLPPSRYQNGVLWGVNGYFSYVLCGKIWIFHCVRVVFGDFVIIVLSRSIIYATHFLVTIFLFFPLHCLGENHFCIYM